MTILAQLIGRHKRITLNPYLDWAKQIYWMRAAEIELDQAQLTKKLTAIIKSLSK